MSNRLTIIFLIVIICCLQFGGAGMKGKGGGGDFVAFGSGGGGCNCNCDKDKKGGPMQLVAMEKIIKVPRIMMIDEGDNDGLNYEDDGWGEQQVGVAVNPSQQTINWQPSW